MNEAEDLLKRTPEINFFEAFMQEILQAPGMGFDLHRHVAALLFDISPLEVLNNQRMEAKVVLYTRLSRGTEQDVANTIGNPKRAAYLWRGFDQHFPKLAEILK